MSCAPRPRTSPSTTSPAQGSKLHSDGSAGTVSTWPSRHSVGPGLSPRRRRPGWAGPARRPGARTRSPRRVSVSASSSCAGSSLPGGLTVSSRISSLSRSTASEPVGRSRLRPLPPPSGRLMRCRPRRSNASGSGSYWIHRAAFRHRRGAAAAGPACRRARRRSPRGCARARSTSSSGQEHLLGRGVGAADGDRDGRAALGDPLRPARAPARRRWRGSSPPPRSGAFEEESAVNAGRAEVRAVIERAEERRRATDQPTIFFLDEIHRFNKAQQDALLPAVEEGLVTLIGATTENPYFEVNSALLSRAQIYELRPLGPGDIRRLLDRALADPERGPGRPARGRGGGPRAPGRALRRRRAHRVVGPRAGGRDCPRRRPRGRPRRRRGRAAAQGAQLTTGRATATTTTSRPGSRRPAGPTPTPPSTTWR